MINAEQYNAAMDKFIRKMESINDMLVPEISEAFSELCEILRIGRINVVHYDSPWHEAMNRGKSLDMFDGGNSDPLRYYKIKETIENGNVAFYTFFQIACDDNWNNEEREKVCTLQKLLFTFNGRINLRNIARRLTYTDPQLEVYNLNHFMKTLGELVSEGKVGQYGACFFNLKRFSMVNNQVGRNLGTQVMKDFVHAIASHLDEPECVCRVGGDNFTVLFKKEKFNVIQSCLNETPIFEPTRNVTLLVGAYQGYYMIPDDEKLTANDIMDRLSVARSAAKSDHTASYIIYNNEIRSSVDRAKLIENLFPYAIRDEEFMVYYQPKVSLKDGFPIIGAEALCRWKHGCELVSPVEFIPVLEQSKLICQLDFYMLDHVCRDIRKWLDEGKNVVRVSVNMSRVHLGDANILEKIMNIIARNDIPHEYIEIELTETAFDIDYTELKKIVCGLAEQGIRTSIDDFGTGYSSLNLMRELPWNTLKVDKSLLPIHKTEESKNMIMLKYIIAMANELGLECIVEGVETQEQVELLIEHNCYLAQGYYFSTPLPKDVFEEKLANM